MIEAKKMEMIVKPTIKVKQELKLSLRPMVVVALAVPKKLQR